MLSDSQVMPNFRRDFDNKKTRYTEGVSLLLKTSLKSRRILEYTNCKFCKKMLQNLQTGR